MPSVFSGEAAPGTDLFFPTRPADQVAVQGVRLN